MNRFQERLKEAMNEKKLSQAELARRSGIGRNSISDYLKGKYEAKQDKVHILAKTLNVDEGWLMGFDTEKNKIFEYEDPKKDDYSNVAETIAAHIDDDATEEEIEEILAYIEMRKSLRRNKKK